MVLDELKKKHHCTNFSLFLTFIPLFIHKKFYFETLNKLLYDTLVVVKIAIGRYKEMKCY